VAGAAEIASDAGAVRCSFGEDNRMERPSSLGFGLGLRPQYYREIFEEKPRIDWFEVISENFMVPGGQPLAMLERIRNDYPIVMHGVSMSIASTAPLDQGYLAALKALAERFQPEWISDHLCWTGVHGVNLHDILPIPYTAEALGHVFDRIRRVQDFLGRRIAIENVSSYVTFAESEMDEWTFVRELCERADCWLLFDVNNIFVSFTGNRIDEFQRIEIMGTHKIDTHDQPVTGDVWSLYANACRRFWDVSAMIERDDNFPPFEDLLAELEHARMIQAEVLSQQREVTA
jgi:uncharacterized protein